MNRTLRTSMAALAMVGFVAQPITANAGVLLDCPWETAVGGNPSPLPILAVTGFFLCAGFTLGKVDADDARGIKKAERGDHARALLACLLPFHHKHANVVSAKG